MSDPFQAGNILQNERISFEMGEVFCPIEFGEPNEFWCVMRSEGDLLQLVPVSGKPLDNDRPGVMPRAERVYTINGHVVYLLLGFVTYKFKQEFSPAGDGTYVSDTVAADGFKRCLDKFWVKRCPKVPAPTVDVNWYATWFIRGELWNLHGKPEYATATVADALASMEEYDMPSGAPPGTDLAVRKWLVSHGKTTPLIKLV